MTPKPTTAAFVAEHDDEQGEFTQVAVEELEALLAIAVEYRKIPVSDGRHRLRQRRLLKRLEAARADG